jgi:TonB family protein
VGSAPGREVGSLRPAAPAQTATAPPPRIDLFPAATLCKTVGCAEGPPADPGQALQARLAAEQAERAGAEDVRAGRVDPLWREVERDAEKSFAPPEKSVTSASRGELALRQLFRPVQPAPETTQAGWLVNSDTGRRIANEVRAAQDAYDEAAVGCEAEIEAEIDAEGEVVAVRILRSSGHRAFDAEALRAVRQALRLRPPSSRQESRGPVLARYALRGEVAVNLPRVGLVTEPNTGASHTPLAQVAGTFDEVTGKGEVRVPFLKRLKKSVRLLSVRRR